MVDYIGSLNKHVGGTPTIKQYLDGEVGDGHRRAEGTQLTRKLMGGELGGVRVLFRPRVCLVQPAVA